MLLLVDKVEIWSMRANQDKPVFLSQARRIHSLSLKLFNPRSFYKIAHLCKKSHFLLRNLFLVNQSSSLGIEVGGFYVLMFSSFTPFTIVSFCLIEFWFFDLPQWLFLYKYGRSHSRPLLPQLNGFYVSVKEVNRKWILFLPIWPFRFPWISLALVDVSLEILVVVFVVVCTCGDGGTIGWNGESLDRQFRQETQFLPSMEEVE